MTLRCREQLRLKFGGEIVHFDPGAVFTVTNAQAQRVLARFPGKLEIISLPPAPPIEPLQPGWSITYRDAAGRLRGGCDEREAGTVQECRWQGNGWTVELTNGDSLPIQRIVSVGKTDRDGKIIAAWTTRGHGYDGEGNTNQQLRDTTQ